MAKGQRFSSSIISSLLKTQHTITWGDSLPGSDPTHRIWKPKQGDNTEQLLCRNSRMLISAQTPGHHPARTIFCLFVSLWCYLWTCLCVKTLFQFSWEYFLDLQSKCLYHWPLVMFSSGSFQPFVCVGFFGVLFSSQGVYTFNRPPCLSFMVLSESASICGMVWLIPGLRTFKFITSQYLGWPLREEYGEITVLEATCLD